MCWARRGKVLLLPALQASRICAISTKKVAAEATWSCPQRTVRSSWIRRPAAIASPTSLLMAGNSEGLVQYQGISRSKHRRPPPCRTASPRSSPATTVAAGRPPTLSPTPWSWRRARRRSGRFASRSLAPQFCGGPLRLLVALAGCLLENFVKSFCGKLVEQLVELGLDAIQLIT